MGIVLGGPKVSNREKKSRKKQLTLTDKGAHLFFARVKLYTRAHSCVHSHLLGRFIAGANLEIHGRRFSTCRASRIAMRARCARLSPLVAPSRRYFFSALLSAALCSKLGITHKENDLGPMRPLAGPRRSPDRRLARCKFSYMMDERTAERNQADTLQAHIHPLARFAR